MKSLFVTILLVLATASSAFAQTPTFRNQGYKGSVTYTNHCILFNGFETSHGYMFNEHHYLGGGVGAFVLVPVDDLPAFLKVYADYHAYIRDKKSTPVVGVKFGFAHSFVMAHGSDANGMTFINAMNVEPEVAWSWGLKSGYGLKLGLHADAYLFDYDKLDIAILPKLSFSFEF